MSMTRTSYVAGPAVVVLGSVYHYVDEKGKIKVEDITDLFEVNVGGYGKVDDRKKASYVKISFTPCGMYTTGIVASLLPWLNTNPGASMPTGTDTTVIIWPFSGTGKRSILGAFVSKMCNVQLAPQKLPFGSVEITALGKDNTAVTDSSKLDVIASASMSDTSFSVAGILTCPYTVSIGALSAPWNGVKTDENGVMFNFAMSHKMIYVAGEGYIDARLESVKGTLEFTPMNVTEAQAFALYTLGAAADGASLAALGADITVTGGTGNPIAVGKSATLVGLPSGYDNSSPRTEKLKFNLQRASGTGAIATFGVAS